MYAPPLPLRFLRSLLILSLILGLTSSCGGGGGGGSPSPAPVQDTTPNAFSFAAISGAERSSVVESGAVTISGINAATDVSIAGGEYSIAGGAYTSGAGTVSNGEAITVRVTTAADYDTETSATLTVGGVSGNFSVTTLAAPQVLIDVNVNVRHNVGGVDSFDRAKYITIHSSPSDHDWFGNNAQSRNEPNALPDLMQDFLGGKDVYLGRNTGGITWYLGEMDEDAARPGFVDETDSTNTGEAVRSNYSNNMDLRWVSTRAHDHRAVNMIVGAQQHPFGPECTTTRQGWALSQTDTVAEPFGTASGHWMGQYLSKFFRPIGSGADGQDKPPLVEVMNEPVYDLYDAASTPEPLDRIFEYHLSLIHI